MKNLILLTLTVSNLIFLNIKSCYKEDKFSEDCFALAQIINNNLTNQISKFSRPLKKEDRDKIINEGAQTIIKLQEFKNVLSNTCCSFCDSDKISKDIIKLSLNFASVKGRDNTQDIAITIRQIITKSSHCVIL